uniref:putative nuclease HARBI1 n=1 Tax=Pristiophorus japonicus TaxID=55135 RepID=UPI00398EF018
MDLMDDQCLRRLRFHKDIVTERCNLLQPNLQPQTRLRTTLTIASKVTIALNLSFKGWRAANEGLVLPVWAAASGSSQSRRQKCLPPKCRRGWSRAHGGSKTCKEKALKKNIGTPSGDPIQHLGGQEATYTTRPSADVSGRFPAALASSSLQARSKLALGKTRGGMSAALVCDHNRKVMAVGARYPGSSHDAFILRQIDVPGVFAGPNQDCDWLLGDKGYSLCTWLLTPLCHPRTAAQQSYNDSHSPTRFIIEQTIGILKQRFRCLDC